MAGATRRTLILAFTVLAVCACERRRFCVAGAALRGSFGSLVDLSSEALKVQGEILFPAANDMDVDRASDERGEFTGLSEFAPIDGLWAAEYFLNTQTQQDPRAGSSTGSSKSLNEEIPSRRRCSDGGVSDECARASGLSLLRVDVLVESLRLNRWSLSARGNDPEVQVDAAVSDLGKKEDADTWSAMSGDEVDLFFADADEYEDESSGETVILQLAA